MVFITEGFFLEAAIEHWPEWDLNPRPEFRSGIHIYIYKFFYGRTGKNIIKLSEYKLYLWWSYIDNIFVLWEHDENKLKLFVQKINQVHPTIRFRAEWSKISLSRQSI